MKRIIVIFTLICFFSCSKESICDTTPSFSSITASEISYTSFTVSGTIKSSNCDSNIISQGIVYSISELPTQSDNKIIFSNSSYSESITGLSFSTKYYVRTFLENQDGVFFGNQTIVTTLSKTISFTNINQTASITTVNITGNYSFSEGQGVNTLSKGVLMNGKSYNDNESAEGIITIEITGLESNTSYSYSLFINNEFGISQSQNFTFKTDDSSSVVSETNISNITYTNVSFSATYENLYSGNDITTDKGFVLSKTNNFENPVNYSSTSASGIIEKSLTNLEPNTVYYVKGFVENVYGTNYGNVTSFETNNPAYNFNPINVSSIEFQQANASIVFNEVEAPFITPISKGFEVSENENFNSSIEFIDNINIESGKSIELVLNNLEINKNYFVRAFVSNTYGKFYSNTFQFQTLNLEYQYSYVVNSLGYDFGNITVNFSQISGPNIAIIEKGVEIYNNNSYQVIDNSLQDGDISVQLPNLTHNTNYLFTAYVLTEFGKIYFYDGIFVNTLNATPTISSSVSNIGFDNSTIEAILDFAPDTTNSLVRIVLTDNATSQYIKLDNSDTNQSTLVSSLMPNTNYSYRIEVVNLYGSFQSQNYNFTTVNDEPSIDFSYELTGENEITLSGLITPAVHDNTISAVYIDYKHNEEVTFKRLNLSNTNYSISEILNDLMQGPNYNFKLVIINKWNSFEENVYYNIPVTYKVGDIRFGGLVSVIDNTGYHGIITAELKYFSRLEWSSDSNASDELQYLKKYEYVDGAINTEIIVNHHANISASAPAADYCVNLSVNGYDDWYLPSHQEVISFNFILWEFYGPTAMNPFNRLWTSNTDPNDWNKAETRAFNGCNPCTGSDPKEIIHAVSPIRKF